MRVLLLILPAAAATVAMAQFIPDKPVTIHPAVESRPVRQGDLKGPGAGLGATKAALPPAGRSGRGGRAGAPLKVVPPAMPEIPAAAAAVEQTAQGERPPIPLSASFDGLGEGFQGGRGGIDISLAVGPDHLFEVLNGNMAVFTKKGKKYGESGKLLYGPVPNNTVFAGFGNRCSVSNNADSVVRYDQFAGRWLIVVPVFTPPYAMCYAVSASADPLGAYYRYEFERPLFPDYPRPTVWPDGYYLPTSTSDNALPGVVTQKHDCVADRAKMLRGEPAIEQCIVIDGAVFLMNSDALGKRPPPAGAPNIVMSTGGTQLLKRFVDDGIYFYKLHVDWNDPAKTSLSPPRKIPVAPYHYLCDGQLSDCVPQTGTDRRLDSQGDKLMQGLVYRNFGKGRESILAEHSVATAAHGGGIRWYEFRLDRQRDPVLFQQGTYAPDRFFRWLASMAMDRKGNIGIGYSFGGDPNYPGQRVTARRAGDPRGRFTYHESVLAEGQASQPAMRWEDYTNIAVDPSDDCTFWFVGNYLKRGAATSSTRIGSFAVPGCR